MKTREQELFIERAAQLEYDGNLPREEAEKKAQEEIEEENRLQKSG